MRVHQQVEALHEPDRQGRTAGPPDPQRLAGEEILESPNVLDAAALRVGTTRGPFMVHGSRPNARASAGGGSPGTGQARTDRGSSGPAAAGRRGDLGKSKRAQPCGAAAG